MNILKFDSIDAGDNVFNPNEDVMAICFHKFRNTDKYAFHQLMLTVNEDGASCLCDEQQPVADTRILSKSDWLNVANFIQEYFKEMK